MSVTIDKMGRLGAHRQAMETDPSGGGAAPRRRGKDDTYGPAPAAPHCSSSGGGGVAAKKRSNDRKRLQNMTIMKMLAAKNDNLRGVIYDGASCAFFAENLHGYDIDVVTGEEPHTQNWRVSFALTRSHQREELLQLCEEGDGGDGDGDAADGFAAAGLAAAEQNGVRALSLALQQSVLDAGFVSFRRSRGFRSAAATTAREPLGGHSIVVGGSDAQSWLREWSGRP